MYIQITMINGKIVSCFLNNNVHGGYGDRIVGIISTKLCAKILGKDFGIFWQKENVSDWIDYHKYQSTLPVEIHNLIDLDSKSNKGDITQYLVNAPLSNIFNNKNGDIGLLSNSDISQYLYENKSFKSKELHYDGIITEYKQLYTDTLKPTQKSLDIINSLVGTNTTTNIIGIQIRTGDKYMTGSDHQIFDDPETQIYELFLLIKSQQPSQQSYRVFITSDYVGCYAIATKVWNSGQIIYYDEVIEHIDKPTDKNNNIPTGIAKMYIDNYILSQCTSRLYISDYSNYGRIAGLSCKHGDVYDLYGTRVNLRELISKSQDEQLISSCVASQQRNDVISHKIRFGDKLREENTVSIVIASYNRFYELVNAISSVLNQTYKPYEIIVINDHSTQEEYYSFDWEKCGVKIQHLRVNTKELFEYPCGGFCRTIGMKMATGKYIALLDDDDYWLPNKLETQITEMIKHNTAFSCTNGIIGTEKMFNPQQYQQKQEVNQTYSDFQYQETQGQILPTEQIPDILDHSLMQSWNYVICSSVVVSREIMKKIEYMDSLPNGKEDYKCWLDILSTNLTKCRYIKTPLVYYNNSHYYKQKQEQKQEQPKQPEQQEQPKQPNSESLQQSVHNFVF
jgi:hypothetical protein